MTSEMPGHTVECSSIHAITSQDAICERDALYRAFGPRWGLPGADQAHAERETPALPGAGRAGDQLLAWTPRHDQVATYDARRLPTRLPSGI